MTSASESAIGWIRGCKGSGIIVIGASLLGRGRDVSYPYPTNKAPFFVDATGTNKGPKTTEVELSDCPIRGLQK